MAYAPFVSTISKFKLQKLDDLVSEDRVAARLDPTGFYLARTSLVASSIRPIIQDMLTKLPLIAQGPQTSFLSNYNQISALWQLITESVEQHDSKFPDENKCRPLLTHSFTAINNLQSCVPNFVTAAASRHTHLIEPLTEQLNGVIADCDSITTNVATNEAALTASLEAIPQSEQESCFKVACALAALDQLLVDMSMLAAYLVPNAQQPEVAQQKESMVGWIQQVKALINTLFSQARADTAPLMQAISTVSNQLQMIATVFAAIQPLLIEKPEFSRCSITLMTAMQVVNDIEAKSLLHDTSDILKNFAQLYSNNKPVNQYLARGREILVFLKDKIAAGAQIGMKSDVISTYGTLCYLVERCGDDVELGTMTLLSIIRFVAKIFPDSQTAEDLLVSLLKKITLILKAQFKDAHKILGQLTTLIDTNLEFLNDQALNQVNYFLSNAKASDEFDPESKEFMQQQTFFFQCYVSLSSLLSKLVTGCSDPDTKTQLTQFIEQLQITGKKYARWLGQLNFCLAGIILNRSENTLNTLSFPMTVLHTLGKGDALKNLVAATNAIQTTLQNTPQLQLMNLGDIIEILKNFQSVNEHSNDFLKIVNQFTQSACYPLFRLGASAITKITTKMPDHIASLLRLTTFNDNETFITAMIATLQTILLIGQENQQHIAKKDSRAPFFLSIPFTNVLTADAFVHAYPALGNSVLQYMQPIRQTIDIVWPIANDIAMSKNPPEANYLPTYSERMIKNTTELLAAVLEMPQPETPYDIPDDIQEIKRYDATAAAIHSAPIKAFAQYLVRTMKKSTAADVRAALQQWFTVIHSQPVEVAEGVKIFTQHIIQLLSGATTDRSQFIEGFSILSYSLAYHENGYGKTVAPFIAQSHRQLVSLIVEYLESSRNSQVQLMRIIASVDAIAAFAPISKLKQKEMEGYLTTILKNVVISLHALRTKGNTPDIKQILTALSDLKCLDSYFQVAPPTDDLGLSQLLENMITGRSRKQLLDESIKRISARLLELIPNQYNTLERIRDTDTVCDFVYDKAEAFRENVNMILNFSKTRQCTMAEISKEMTEMILGASDAALLTMHSLTLGGLVFTPFANTFVDCFSELSSGIAQFSVVAFQVPQTKNDMGPELRKINRKMSKQFDTFINIVENPQRPTGEIPEFDQCKNQMYAHMLALVEPLARLLALCATSLVPEMYTDNRVPIMASQKDAIAQLKESIDKVLLHAVGASSSEFGGLVPQLISKLKELEDSSAKVNFGIGIFTPEPILAQMLQVCGVVLHMSQLGPVLTDKIVIDPDPTAAAKVPEDYVVPALPKQAPPPSDALQNMSLAKKQLDESIVAFNQTNEQTLATSQDLLQVMNSLRENINSFAEKALAMAVATVDARYQVEQQTALHAFANAVNAVQAAMRSRLLRTPQFSQEMEEAMVQFNAAIKKSMELADIASKIEVEQEEDDSMDDVTRELAATSKAIEKMSAKLKEFQNQVNMEDIDIEDEVEEAADGATPSAPPTIEAEEGTLPAFLIASATPTLTATGQILKRAQEITVDLIRKFGRIDNERGLIRSAQDLSEAAELLLICAEILVKGTEADAEFKVIAAARIIKASVSSLVAQVLVKGGDSEGIMNTLVKNVIKYTDKVIERSESIVDKKLTEEEAKKPKKQVNNPMILRLNMQQQVNQQRKVLQDEEKALYQFRRKA